MSPQHGRQALAVPDAVRATRLVRSEASALVLRELLSAEKPLRFRDILDPLDLGRSTVTRALDQLEEQGIVQVDLPRGERTGRGPLYSVDRARLHAIWSDYFAWLYGATDGKPAVPPA